MAWLGLSTAQNWIVFTLYIGLSINNAVLTTASQDDKKYKFNATSAVILVEVLKLLTSGTIFLFWERQSVTSLLREVTTHKKVMALYCIPAFLYSLSNNLVYINLSLHDPATFIILIQLRIAFSGVLYQVLFNKKLSWSQWVSLLILTSGCIIKHVDFSADTEAATWRYKFPLTVGLFYMLLQSFMSLFAGVYTEYLLKGKKDNVNLWVQNIYMYSHSIIWNIFFAFLGSNVIQEHFWETSETILQPKVIAVVLNSSLQGIVASIFLKTLNSIVKSFAIAIEMVLMPVLGNILFSVPVSPATILSIVLIILAIQIFSRNPLVNRPVLPRARKDSMVSQE